ncbi:NAD+ synthase (glutamine-hydrolysing) [Marinobacter daqiaonensis]|uniref:Glutamine-dependent NAD(+) synthetase n=1 Tax=Marinobacter daqiaonensis TaxID=650891 RepID=A0A1I6H014_9GAMM|nr:NAD(+) synthase [Marinobacter daqiaonensis]SFR47687.1 NAD+ synthase (glutamine-hydrolysing) [Marinobacter daqiaonensis]
MQQSFNSIYTHGFIRAAVCIPSVRVADPQFNAERTLELARRASDLKAAIALFPELGISAYSNDDLFHQDALLDATLEAVSRLIEESRSLTPVLLIGAPLRFEGKLFNCGVVIHRGQVLGIIPKSYLPNYREFYEKRQFSAARAAVGQEVRFLGEKVPFGNELIFNAVNLKGFSLHVEICEDVWTPIPPSTYAALAGATVLANLSASNATIGKAKYRRDLCASQSGKCIAAYLYSAAGPGESTTDLAWDGYALIYENDEMLAQAEQFSDEEQVIAADIDLERLAQDRMRMTSFNDVVTDHRDRVRAIRQIDFEFQVPTGEIALMRDVGRFPYVPTDPAERDERCFEAYNIQIHGLMKRMNSAGLERVVIGVSGGLDSTHALIVAAKTMDRLGLPRSNILAYTLPGFATSDKTLENALGLMEALDVTAEEIDIRPSCMQMFEDLGHPFAQGEEVYDVTFENVQAGQRTSHLFRLANHHNAMVLGTGDLSELALGWCTYGVGDHMSHYNVNASVPKTLIQHLIRWVINSRQFEEDTRDILQSILDTEISPELVPAPEDDRDRPVDEKPIQSTQDKIGPYDLQDFNTYYITRYGFRPSKVAFLSYHAWSDKRRGSWPDLLPVEKHIEYDLPTIRKWLEVFLYRFFKISQFKRSCVPNGPKVGSGGSLSPRGDWRAPSDSEAQVWLDELRRNVPEY